MSLPLPTYMREKAAASGLGGDAVVNQLRFVLLIICYASQDTAILHPQLGPASLGHKFHCDANDSFTNPIDGSPPGSPIPGILQERTLEWVAISFSSA